MVRRIGLQQAKQGGDDVPPLQGHPGLSDASEGTGVPESRGEVGVQDPEHHDGARDTRWRDDRMTGRRSHGRLSALNGVVHQGTPRLAGAQQWRAWIARTLNGAGSNVDDVRFLLHQTGQPPAAGGREGQKDPRRRPRSVAGGAPLRRLVHQPLRPPHAAACRRGTVKLTSPGHTRAG